MKHQNRSRIWILEDKLKDYPNDKNVVQLATMQILRLKGDYRGKNMWYQCFKIMNKDKNRTYRSGGRQ